MGERIPEWALTRARDMKNDWDYGVHHLQHIIARALAAVEAETAEREQEIREQLGSAMCEHVEPLFAALTATKAENARLRGAFKPLLDTLVHSFPSLANLEIIATARNALGGDNG